MKVEFEISEASPFPDNFLAEFQILKLSQLLNKE